MNSTLPRAVLWDMDGTLIDTERLWAQATFEMSEQLGRRLTPEERKKTEGGSFESTFRIAADWAGVKVTSAALQHWKQWLDSRMEVLLAGNVELNPGVEELLEAFRAKGIPMAIATNTERKLADPCIDAIGRDFFQLTVAGDEVADSKPAPDMYLRAAEGLGVSISDCVVVEDSWPGMKAGAASGAVVFGLADVVPDDVQAMGQGWLAQTSIDGFASLYQQVR